MTKNSKRQLAETRTSLIQQRKWWQLCVERKDHKLASIDKEIQELQRRRDEAVSFADKSPGAIIKIDSLLAGLDSDQKQQADPVVKNAKSKMRQMKKLLASSPEILEKLSSDDLALLQAMMGKQAVSLQTD